MYSGDNIDCVWSCCVFIALVSNEDVPESESASSGGDGACRGGAGCDVAAAVVATGSVQDGICVKELCISSLYNYPEVSLKKLPRTRLQI